MSATYPDYTYTNFPDNVDTFNYFTDISLANLPLAKQYYQLYNAGDIEGATAILNANPSLKNSFIGASTLNPIIDAVKAIEKFYSQDVQQYLANIVQHKGDFSATTKYSKYNTVSYYIDGASEVYICINSNTPIGTLPTNTTYWIPLTMRGEQGESGIGLTAYGAWNVHITYPADAMVAYNNALWGSLIQNIGIVPAETATSTWYKIIEFSADMLTFIDSTTSDIYKLLVSNGTISMMSDSKQLDIALKSDVDTQITEVVNYQKAGGTSTAITLTGISFVDGFSKTFIVTSNNNSGATTINGKPLYKPNTTTPPKLTAGKAVTVWYNSSGGCFFFKASAEGDAVATDVLAGKIFSTDDGTLTGTIPSKAAATYNPSTAAQTIAAGQYLSGAQTIAATTGTANTGQVLSGATFNSSNGINLTGTMPNLSGAKPQVANHGTPMSVYQDPTDARMGIVELPNQLAGSGYIDSTTKIKAQLWGLTPENIKKGVAIGQYPGYGTGYMTGTYDGLSDIKGVIRAYYAYAGENISAGDFVEFIGGVSGLGAGAANWTQVVSQITVAAIAISDTQVLLAMQSGTSYGAYAILTINGITYSLGTLVSSGVFNSLYGAKKGKLLKLSATQCVYVGSTQSGGYQLLTQVINISGGVITSVSGLQTITTLNTNYSWYGLPYFELSYLDATHFSVWAGIIGDSSGYSYAIPCTVSGNTITPGSLVTCPANGTTLGSSNYRAQGGFTPDGTRLFILRDYNSNTTLTFTVYLVGQNSITYYNQITYSNSGVANNSTGLFAMLPLDATDYLIVSDNSTNTYITGVWTDYGTSSIISQVQLTTGAIYQIRFVRLDSSRVLIVYKKVGEAFLRMVVATITNGSAVTLGTEVTVSITDSTSPIDDLTQLIGAKVFLLVQNYYGLILNAPGTTVDFLNYMYETQVRKSTNNATINGVALQAMIGGTSTEHNQSGNVVSKT